MVFSNRARYCLCHSVVKVRSRWRWQRHRQDEETISVWNELVYRCTPFSSHWSLHDTNLCWSQRHFKLLFLSIRFKSLEKLGAFVFLLLIYTGFSLDVWLRPSKQRCVTEQRMREREREGMGVNDHNKRKIVICWRNLGELSKREMYMLCG